MNFENWCTFTKVMTKSQVPRFLGDTMCMYIHRVSKKRPTFGLL